MANDELQAMARDELFWDPSVDSDAVASDCHTGALVPPGTCPNMTIIVSDGETPVAAGAK